MEDRDEERVMEDTELDCAEDLTWEDEEVENAEAEEVNEIEDFVGIDDSSIDSLVDGID